VDLRERGQLAALPVERRDRVDVDTGDEPQDRVREAFREEEIARLRPVLGQLLRDDVDQLVEAGLVVVMGHVRLEGDGVSRRRDAGHFLQLGDVVVEVEPDRVAELRQRELVEDLLQIALDEGGDSVDRRFGARRGAEPDFEVRRLFDAREHLRRVLRRREGRENRRDREKRGLHGTRL
jgi:hypothetical protein